MPGTHQEPATQTHRPPEDLHPRELRRRALPVVIGLTVLVAIVVLTPGLGDVRHKLDHASPGWIAIAVLLEAASCASYVVMFGPVFCGRMSWRAASQIGLSEQAVGSLVPASGIGGLALGAWILRRQGMDPDRIARRSVAFFLIKSSVNFAAVMVVGTLMAVGVAPGGPASLWLTALPAALAGLVIVLVLSVPRLGPGTAPGDGAGRARQLIHRAREALVEGTAEAVAVVRARNVLVIAGALGYWAFDNAMLWACFQAVGESPPIAVVLMGYLIGQLGGLLPIPGGIGGVDGGLLGALVVYGAPAAASAAAVLAFRLILFWVPLVLGVPAFLTLWRDLPPESPERT